MPTDKEAENYSEKRFELYGPGKRAYHKNGKPPIPCERCGKTGTRSHACLGGVAHTTSPFPIHPKRLEYENLFKLTIGEPPMVFGSAEASIAMKAERTRKKEEAR